MALARLNAFFIKRPLVVSLVGNTIKTAAADVFTQKYLEEKDELDLKRLAVFTSFGLTYLGGWQYFLFNKLFVRCEKMMTFAKWQPLTQASILTFLDLGLHTPLMYYPAFYSIKSYLDGKTVANTMTTYNANIQSDMVAMWKIWLPAQMTNFMFIPLHMRMPFIASVSFGWTIVLSMMRGGNS